MTNIPPINSSSFVSTPSTNRGSLAIAPAASEGLTDQLELSDVAQILGRLPVNTSIRAEKVAQVRQAIQAGTYETTDKMEQTLDRLMDVLKLR